MASSTGTHVSSSLHPLSSCPLGAARMEGATALSTIASCVVDAGRRFGPVPQCPLLVVRPVARPRRWRGVRALGLPFLHETDGFCAIEEPVRAAPPMRGHDCIRRGALTGVRDRGQPGRWARPDGAEPRHASSQQLRLGYRVWRMLEQTEGRDVALAWLVGANPRLDEQTPVTAIRELRSAEVVGAALAFIDGSSLA